MFMKQYIPLYLKYRPQKLSELIGQEVVTKTLLKTLEEPPKNVIFILATTEEHKVIPTIVSRCQRLDFKPVFKKELEERIKYIAKEEKIVIDETAIKFISKRSSGCLRDAISLLDQISVLQDEDKSIDPKEVFALFGTVD